MSFEKLDDKDIWRLDSVRQRYRDYCRRYNVEHEEIVVDDYCLKRAWTAGVIQALIVRMKQGDLAAAEIGIELMEEDRGLAFGPIVKSNLPRALARCPLTDLQKDRIRRRTVAMLLRAFLPKEFREYARLTRRLGLDDNMRLKLLTNVDRTQPWANYYMHYVIDEHPPRPPSPFGDRWPWATEVREL